MANVVRQDVVQVGFDIGDSLKEIKKLQDEINDLKKKLTGGVGEDAFDDLKNKSNESVKPLKKIKEQADKVTQSVTNIGKKAATTAFRGLKKVASISFKGLAVGIGAAATAIGTLTYKSVQAYADYEQLVGGVETLFKDSAPIVQKYANDAFKTAGLSANDYMETVTSFSASLLQSLKGDTKKSAEYADMAVSDMADNANKMGTDMSMIQNAYQGFAKQNYTMLDNLKLGYGGTKEEMKRLVNDAAKMDKSVKSNDMSFGNLVKAIHAVQVKMDIYGTTQKEAEHTITGSLNMVKSAWGNLMPALIKGGDSFEQCIDNLVYSVDKFSDNAMPALLKALSGVGKLIEKLAPKIEKEFPRLVDELLPPLIKAAASLVAGLIKALPNIIKTVAKEIPNITKELVEAIYEAFTGKNINYDVFPKMEGYIKSLGNAIKWILPIVIALVAAFKGFKVVKSIGSLFGGSGKGDTGKSGGIFGSITNAFSNLAKTKSTTILKGMANLSIIIGGFTILTAALMAIAPKIAKLSDSKTVVKMVAIISMLGVVGTALTLLAGIVGKIPVSTVVLGLANIAIIISGMSALFLLIGAVSLLNFDYKKMLKIVGIIGVLGTVGSALSLFAGIVGMIPVPVVLLGLANIALVIGGLTALIAAYGALGEIPGFNEFISKGGDVLANLFKQLGKIVGAIVGGIGEGITNSLPKIGENLSAFATSLKPMFEMFSGVDMSGAGAFFGALGSFMLKMAGNDILSFFTGGTDFAKLGTELNTFATNSRGFFEQVATFPENGFTNATKLFDCLAGLKSLPKDGGVVGWFMGGIDYGKISAGLGKLSNDEVTGFFSKVANIPEAGFNQAKLLFDTLAGLKSLPKDGGVAGWFMGGIDYSKIASGLKSLSSEGVKQFFEMVGGFKKTAFDNAKLFFDTLATIKDMPKEGGLFGWAKGEVNLSGIGSQLAEFATNAEKFLAFVNTLNVENMTALFNALKNLSSIVGDLKNSVSNNFEAIASNVQSSCGKVEKELKDTSSKIKSIISTTDLKPSSEKMMNTFINGITSKKQSAVSAIKSVVSSIIKQINNVISAANYTLKEFGSNDRIKAYNYAKGTSGHKGGNAIVNDGRGAELVQMPNGNTFIPSGKNVFIPNAPKGMKVLPAENTAALMGRNKPTFNYAKGTGSFDIWEYMDNSKGLVSRLKQKFVDYKGLNGAAASIGKGAVTTVSNAMVKWVDKLFDKMGALSLANYNASKGVEQWKSTVIRALKMEGQYSEANVKRTLYQMQTESGGNPRAINLWDSNAKKGIPSKGLMQVIDPTFRAYARPGFDKNIYDPLSNILASIRYAVSRYGSLAKAYRGVGYANGGIVNKPHFGVFGEAGAEALIPLSSSKRQQGLSLWSKAGEMLGVSAYNPETDSTRYRSSTTVENNTYSPQFTLNIGGTNDDRATERKVKRWIQEAMDEVFDSMSRKNPRLREV